MQHATCLQDLKNVKENESLVFIHVTFLHIVEIPVLLSPSSGEA